MINWKCDMCDEEIRVIDKGWFAKNNEKMRIRVKGWE
jgi:hypothetical protein